MTDRPILFSGPMIRALLAGTKTQTRRIIKPRGKGPSLFNGDWSDSYVLDPGNESWRKNDIRIEASDRLWVKETVRAEELPDGLDGVRYLADDFFVPIGNTASASIEWLKLHTIYGKKGASAPSIFMPRWASRLTLTVTDVRVERLQDISDADAIAEGITLSKEFPDRYLTPAGDYAVPVIAYQRLWESINRPGSWDANPWIVAYTFTVHRQNIDAMSKEAA
jgi:hypothetical protein